MNVVLIGAGNLATNLAKELHSKSINISQVYSRTIESAKLLAENINASFTNDIKEIASDADLYIFSLKDSVLEEVIKSLTPNNGIWVHTSGSIPSDVFEGYTDRYGVIYPLQTFSKQRRVDFKEIPFFTEANNIADLALLDDLCYKLSDTVHNLSSEKRKYIHLTAVFACNFTNHLYAISNTILSEENIPFDVLLPLIDETAKKVHTMKPSDAQTGPAIRYDENVINKHLALLDNPLHKSIYTLISQSIFESNKSNN